LVRVFGLQLRAAMVQAAGCPYTIKYDHLRAVSSSNGLRRSWVRRSPPPPCAGSPRHRASCTRCPPHCTHGSTFSPRLEASLRRSCTHDYWVPAFQYLSFTLMPAVGRQSRPMICAMRHEP
jgi:hypothetical protein